MSFISRLTGVFRAEKHYAELDEELRFHIDERTEEMMAGGLSQKQARREAMKRFGHYGSQREAARDAGVFRSVEAFVFDLRYGARQLRLNPGFAVVAILSLALGIGANSAIFQLIHALQLRPLPVADAHELVSLGEGPDFYASGRYSGRTVSFTYAQFEQLEAVQTSFSETFAFATVRFNLSRGGEGRFASGLFVTPDFFEGLGVEPFMGRGFDADTDPRDCSGAGAVIDYRFWQREFGGDSNVIGREISLNGVTLPVLAVTPPWFFGLESARRYDVAVPLCVDTLINSAGGGRMESKATWWMVVMGRLKAGVGLEQAAAQIEGLSPGVFRATVPPSYRPSDVERYVENTFTVLSAEAGVSSVREEYQNPLWILLASTALVLLLACANLANLLLARASVREREISLRQAVGASRGRLIAQLMAESLLLAGSGALLGAFFAHGLSKALVFFLDSGSGRLNVRLGVDWQVLGFTAALAAITCLLFGGVPAVRASRSEPADAMRGGRGTSGHSRRHGLRRTLVVAQIGLSLILLVAALLFGQSLRNLMESDTGIDSDGVLLARVHADSVPTDQRVGLYRQLEERFGDLPDVASAGAVIFSPFSGNGWNQEVYLEGSAEDLSSAWFNRVGPDYFSTLKTPLLSGRAFTPHDDASAPQVTIVNEKLASDLFGDENPVGQRLRYRAEAGVEDPSLEIVGVVGNSKYYGLRDEERPFAYLPMAQEGTPMTHMSFVLRVRGTDAGVRNGVQEQMAAVDGSLMVEYRLLDKLIEGTVLRERLMASLSAGFGVLAALLSALGLYGVMSYLVACQRREMGVRMALGAGVGHLVGLVVSEAGRLLGFGLLFGLLGSFAISRFAESLLYGLAPNDPMTLIFGCLLLAVSAGLAILVPLRRAALCDPSVVLRDD